MIVVGIDEAGYGPLLGPLVVSAVAFDVPDDRGDADFWELLRSSVTHKIRQRDPRLVITDSKKLSSRPDGLARLERAALAMLATRSAPPGSLVALLNQLAPHALPDIGRTPWYAGADVALPVAITPDTVATTANALAGDLRANHLTFCGAFSGPITAAVYNRMVGSTRNKAVVLFSLTVRLMQRIADAHPGQPLKVLVDRQGGRRAYREPLMRAFELPELTIIEESPTRSAYALRSRPADCTVEFVTKGDDKHLPIALASIFAKYQRELFMNLLNRFFIAHRPDLTPTAGYYQDGQRFINDLGDDIDQLGIDRDKLIRVS